YPASYTNSNVISVTATNSKDGRPSWANYGKTSVDLGAPGVNVLSTVPVWYASNPYGYGSGTSMATPHVAGVAALILSRAPNLGYADVKSLILNNVDKVSALNNRTVTGGRLNASKAVAAVNSGSTAGTSSSGNNGSGKGGDDAPTGTKAVDGLTSEPVPAE